MTLRSLLFIASIGLAWASPAPAAGCQYDMQCKGERICQMGQCVSPDAEEAAEAAPKPPAARATPTPDVSHGPAPVLHRGRQAQAGPRHRQRPRGRRGMPGHDQLGQTRTGIDLLRTAVPPRWTPTSSAERERLQLARQLFPNTRADHSIACEGKFGGFTVSAGQSAVKPTNSLAGRCECFRGGKRTGCTGRIAGLDCTRRPRQETNDAAYALSERMLPAACSTLIRAGMIAVLSVFCFRIFYPFLDLVLWLPVILAITIYRCTSGRVPAWATVAAARPRLSSCSRWRLLMVPAYLLGDRAAPVGRGGQGERRARGRHAHSAAAEFSNT